MGFYSYDCKICGRSIVNSYATCPVTQWQGEFILFTKGGDILSGSDYEGYGFGDYSEYEEFTIYHKACWEHAGKPEFDGQSRMAADQGYFFNEMSILYESDHDFAPPGIPNPEEWLREKKLERWKLWETRELQDVTRNWYDIFYDEGIHNYYEDACDEDCR